MVEKIMQVFYDANGLPYKDQTRTTHYPIVGNSFMGASNTTKIRFYIDRLGDSSATWVAVGKLPNGKVGNVLLQTHEDSELDEHYAELSLISWFTQMKGDVYISLKGYQGGIQLNYNDQTGLYEATGSAFVEATGSVKLSILYATQLVDGEEVDATTLEDIYALFGTKLNIEDGLVVLTKSSGLANVGNYVEGQNFYTYDTHEFYKNVGGVFTLQFDMYSKSEVDNLINGVDTDLDNHIADHNNPHQVNKTQVGLENVDNIKQYPNTSGLALEQNKADITYVDNQLALKADKSDTYTKAEVNSALSLKANKAETYTKGETDDLLDDKQDKLVAGAGIFINGRVISATGQLQIIKVNELPQTGVNGAIYLVPIEGEEDNVYEEYIWVSDDNDFELIGTTRIDLTDYYTITQIDNLLANKQDTIIAGNNLVKSNNTIRTVVDPSFSEIRVDNGIYQLYVENASADIVGMSYVIEGLTSDIRIYQGVPEIQNASDNYKTTLRVGTSGILIEKKDLVNDITIRKDLFDETVQDLTSVVSGTLNSTDWNELKVASSLVLENTISGVDSSYDFTRVKFSINNVNYQVLLKKNETNKYNGIFDIEEDDNLYEIGVYYNGANIMFRSSMYNVVPNNVLADINGNVLVDINGNYLVATEGE